MGFPVFPCRRLAFDRNWKHDESRFFLFAASRTGSCAVQLGVAVQAQGKKKSGRARFPLTHGPNC